MLLVSAVFVVGLKIGMVSEARLHGSVGSANLLFIWEAEKIILERVNPAELKS
jgi:hypothetical protein